ncbi:MAG: hypothetical protein E7638_03550, partial [Ruminococcaceae bacterium]|nr:hypothetical protein [Oscillospiraceae bacterium]
SNFKRMTNPIDTALSVVWSLRYFECGTFRVIFPMDRELLSAARAAKYLCTGADREGNVHCGRIEYIGCVGDGQIEVSGRMLECLLSDRIMFGPWSFTGTVSDAVFSAVEHNLRGLDIEIGADSDRIPDTITAVSEWDEVSEWIYKTLMPYGGSYTVTLDVTRAVPVFRIVYPNAEPKIVFSGSFENIAEVTYEYHDGDLKNAAVVEGFDGTVEVYDISNGGERREIYRSAKDIRPTGFETTEAYKAALLETGRALLGRYITEEYISCAADRGARPIFGEDYRLGDPCYVDDPETGISVSTRVTEADEVWENGEKTVYPAFGGKLPGIKNKLKNQ